MRTSLKRFSIIPMALAAGLAIATSAQADVQTPISSPVTVRGNSGGSQSSQCGYISSNPNEVLQVSGSPASLRFRVEGQGQPTLLIRGSGNPICVMADSFSGGTIEVPGRLEPGTYSIFVGDRSQANHPFTLSISQEN
ncbi:hypothetical protein IQ268_05275 [Oculatella sp. LEGE 06141]|uniref:hypothetical protein n=1 Tax=Oculatella sp. LEGE 06141 TaxID=1828648 RepID=UPI00187DE456|nr:hypothetical protein [Oculatella sp. LEGE 06141]MBE9177995.1 hypothetical protein [Oculatella sp. LEGE 06141]